MQAQPEPEHVESSDSTEVTTSKKKVPANTNTEVATINLHVFDKPVSRRIWVTFQKEGIHRYPAAAEDPDLQDVAFLAFPHRHIFHFRVEIEVFHDDRDIEFIQFKRYLEKLYNQGTLQLDYKSCEMLAEELMHVINRRYPGRELIVSVSEDNENGATLTLQ